MTNKEFTGVENNTENNITSSTAAVTEGQSTDTASLSNMAKVTIASILMAAASPTFTSCETEKGVDPVEQVDANKLTAEQQAFADKLAPHPDGTLKYSILEGGVDPYIFKNFAKINLKLLNAKGMLYEATPVIQKKSVADVLAKAKELNPGKELYVISLSLVKKSSNGVENVLNTTEEIADKDDNNPSTPTPWLDLLPEEFTLDEFNKHNKFANVPKSYTLNAGEELVVRMYIMGGSNAGGATFSNFNFGVNPTQKVN